MGKQARVDYKHLGAIERGTHTPSFDAIERLGKALKVDYVMFFTPHALVTGEAEEQLRSLVPDANFDSKAVEQFLRDLLAAIRKLQRGGA